MVTEWSHSAFSLPNTKSHFPEERLNHAAEPFFLPGLSTGCWMTLVLARIVDAAGRSLEEIGDYVGHSSAYITDRYRHLIEGARTQAADALDAYLTQGAAR